MTQILQQRLLAEYDFTFDKATKLDLSMELALQCVHMVSGSTASDRHYTKFLIRDVRSFNQNTYINKLVETYVQKFMYSL